MKEITICTCYDFDDIIKFEDFDHDRILIDKKSYKSLLIYNNSNKNLMGATLLRFIFDKIGESIRVDDGSRYLVIFRDEKDNLVRC